MAMATPAPSAEKRPKKDTITDLRFWAASAERAGFTFFQTFAAELVVFKSADIAELGLEGLPWGVMLSVSAFASLTSFVTSIGKVAGGSEGPGAYERLREKKEKKSKGQTPTHTTPAPAPELELEEKKDEEGSPAKSEATSEHFPSTETSTSASTGE